MKLFFLTLVMIKKNGEKITKYLLFFILMVTDCDFAAPIKCTTSKQVLEHFYPPPPPLQQLENGCNQSFLTLELDGIVDEVQHISNCIVLAHLHLPTLCKNKNV